MITLEELNEETNFQNIQILLSCSAKVHRKYWSTINNNNNVIMLKTELWRDILSNLVDLVFENQMKSNFPDINIMLKDETKYKEELNQYDQSFNNVRSDMKENYLKFIQEKIKKKFTTELVIFNILNNFKYQENIEKMIINMLNQYTDYYPTEIDLKANDWTIY